MSESQVAEEQKDDFRARPWYLRGEIVETYESWYEEKYRRAELLEKALLKKLLDRMAPVGSLLEVGCGTTHFTRWFDSMGIRSAGLDISPLMLKQARRYWNGPLFNGSSSHLPFRERSFDVVAFITCFEYMPNPVDVLKEAGRVARKGIVMGLMNRWSLPTIRRMIQVALGKNPYYSTAHFYSAGEMKSLCRKAFGERSFETFQRTTVLPRILGDRDSRLPFGAFLGFSVRLNAPYGTT